tara:strand:+ start:101 stop:1474 length:1374 start_codon:yes stop_codon:yes gene_type:complete
MKKFFNKINNKLLEELSPSHCSQENRLTEIKKGDYVDYMDEIGLVNKVSGRIAYVKFDSQPKSFHPILKDLLKKSGKKHKGKDLYHEGKVNEKIARGLKPLLTLGSKVSWKTMSEDALLDLSDRFDKIDDEVGEDVASYLNMAIENKQDGKQGLATKALKAFNKACKDALKGKQVKSVFEGKLNESMIGIQTKANFKPNTLKGALERAGMKGFQMNRLSVTLTALKLDKKDFEKAKKIIDAMPTAKIMTAKESVNEDKDIGHQDDEPNMLKSTALEIMEYGKKLMDKLDKYDDMEEEVDFPNWWQAKLIIAKEYLQKAYHYLDSEEKTEQGLTEAVDMNDPFLVAVRVMRQRAKEMKELDALNKKAPKKRTPKISFDKYLALLDSQSNIQEDIEDVTRELKQTYSDMEQEAGQKGDKWTDKDANRYGKILNKLESKYEKLKAKKLKIDARVEKYRMS